MSALARFVWAHKMKMEILLLLEWWAKCVLLSIDGQNGTPGHISALEISKCEKRLFCARRKRCISKNMSNAQSMVKRCKNGHHIINHKHRSRSGFIGSHELWTSQPRKWMLAHNSHAAAVIDFIALRWWHKQWKWAWKCSQHTRIARHKVPYFECNPWNQVFNEARIHRNLYHYFGLQISKSHEMPNGFKFLYHCHSTYDGTA